MSSLLSEDVAAHFAVVPHQKAHSVCGQSRRMRFSVRSNAQSAVFRHVTQPRVRFYVSHRVQSAAFREDPQLACGFT